MNWIVSTTFFLFTCSFLVILESCYLFPNNCEDVVYREFTDGEQNVIPYETGDTLHFINQVDGEEYYFTCTEKQLNLRHTNRNPDYYCDNGGTTFISSYAMATLSSNIPSWTSNRFDILLSIGTYSEHFSTLRIYLSGNVEQKIELSVDPETTVFLEKDDSREYYTSMFFDELSIHNKLYRGVNKIYLKENIQGPIPADVVVNAFADTLYYNKEYGILKLTSKKGNLNLVLK